MRQIKIIDNIVVNVVVSKLILEGYVENTDKSVVKGSTLSENGSFVPLVNVFDLEAEKLLKIAELNSNADEKMNSYKGQYPLLEVGSFDKKVVQANAYLKDNEAEVPYLLILVSGDTSKIPALVDSILEKEQLEGQTEAYIVGVRDAIKACTTEEELNAISVELP